MTTARYLSESELQATLAEVEASPTEAGSLVAIVVRPDKELRELPHSAELSQEAGLVGDCWARYTKRLLPDGTLNPDTQLTLMNTRFLGPIAGARENWPLAGDNLLVDFDLSEGNLPAGQKLSLGQAVIQISAEPHTGCAKFSKRFGPDALKFVNSPEGRKLRLRGVNAQVVQPGRIKVGDNLRKV